ncbi:MAG: hypothetical protein FAF04_06445 [Epsilonproteobacteria bacterium]|nr:hypothetical protein [Campylobacterota bacterium]
MHVQHVMILKKGGVDGKPTAIGYKNRPNPSHLNSPTVLNSAYSKHLFLDGRAKSLREQARPVSGNI